MLCQSPGGRCPAPAGRECRNSVRNMDLLLHPGQLFRLQGCFPPSISEAFHHFATSWAALRDRRLFLLFLQSKVYNGFCLAWGVCSLAGFIFPEENEDHGAAALRSSAGLCRGAARPRQSCSQSSSPAALSPASPIADKKQLGQIYAFRKQI